MTKSDEVILKVENLSKQYRLGLVGTGTLSHDLNRWWHRVRGKEDPYLKIGETNDRSQKGESEYVWALKDINFEVKRGEVLGIIGKNGAGKSTLLKILSKVTSPTTGSVKTRGRIASLLEVGTGFHGEMTGRENIYLNGAILGMTKKEIASKIDEIIDFSGCARYIDTPVKRYSSGMTVRLAFAVAAFLEPDILIVDEVLAVGDAEFQKKAIGKMQDISSGEGRTVLFVSHNLTIINSICERVLLIENSRIKINTDTATGIKHYLMSNVNLSNVTKGVFDLAISKNKKIPYGLKTAKVKCNGELTNTILSGSKFSIDIEYDLPFSANNMEIGFKISDIENRAYLGLNNYHIGESFQLEKGMGRAIIEIDDFPFYSKSSYWISLYFGNETDFYECLENEIKIETTPFISIPALRNLDERFNLLHHKDIKISIL